LILTKSGNKLIAKTFKEAKIIERYGSGIMRVRKMCEEYGIKEPDFREALMVLDFDVDFNILTALVFG